MAKVKVKSKKGKKVKADPIKNLSPAEAREELKKEIRSKGNLISVNPIRKLNGIKELLELASIKNEENASVVHASFHALQQVFESCGKKGLFVFTPEGAEPKSKRAPGAGAELSAGDKALQQVAKRLAKWFGKFVSLLLRCLGHENRVLQSTSLNLLKKLAVWGRARPGCLPVFPGELEIVEKKQSKYRGANAGRSVRDVATALDDEMEQELDTTPVVTDAYKLACATFSAEVAVPLPFGPSTNKWSNSLWGAACHSIVVGMPFQMYSPFTKGDYSHATEALATLKFMQGEAESFGQGLSSGGKGAEGAAAALLKKYCDFADLRCLALRQLTHTIKAYTSNIKFAESTLKGAEANLKAQNALLEALKGAGEDPKEVLKEATKAVISKKKKLAAAVVEEDEKKVKALSLTTVDEGLLVLESLKPKAKKALVEEQVAVVSASEGSAEVAAVDVALAIAMEECVVARGVAMLKVLSPEVAGHRMMAKGGILVLPEAFEGKGKLRRLKFASSHDKALEGAWQSVFGSGLTGSAYRALLECFGTVILPNHPNPRLLFDFLTAAYDQGGMSALLSLESLFVLMTDHNIEYPSFYRKLYGMLRPSIFEFRHRERLLKLTGTFLSTKRIPSYIVAAFLKRLCWLASMAPAHGALMVLPLIYNLIHVHPSTIALIHRAPQVDKDSPLDLHGSEMAVSVGATNDPYLPGEKDPAKSRATESSLWELHALMNHANPTVSRLAKMFSTPLTRMKYELNDFTGQSYKSTFAFTLNRKIRDDTPLHGLAPSGLFGFMPPGATAESWGKRTNKPRGQTVERVDASEWIKRAQAILEEKGARDGAAEEKEEVVVSTDPYLPLDSSLHEWTVGVAPPVLQVVDAE